MLIDLLLSEPVIDNVDPISNYDLKATLIAAQKFELSEEFASVAESLMSNYDTIAHAIPFVRLPFPITWIEVAQQHRRRFMEASIHVPELQSVPKRVGMLLTQATEPHRFLAHLFWEMDTSLEPKWDDMPHYKAHASHLAMAFDLKKAETAQPEEHVDDRKDYKFIQMASAPEWIAASSQTRGQLAAINWPVETIYKTGLKPDMPPDLKQMLYELGAADWSGESVFTLATLALYNTVNAVESTGTDFKKLNIKREKQNKPPLQDYHVLTIHPRIKKWVKPSRDPSDKHAELRAHMVRGHWKVRKTGIFFWRHHMRGDATRGLVEKGYKLD